MAHYHSTKSSSKTENELIYEGCSGEELAGLIQDVFALEGYSIKSGDLGNRTYFKGNFAAKVFLGPFQKYFEFHVYMIKLQNDQVKTTIRKTSSGMVDGINGRIHSKKELARLTEMLIEL